MEAEEEADRVWDDTGSRDDGEEDEGLSDWSGSSRSDSGVEVSSSSESEAGSDTTETETESGLPDPGQPGIASRSRSNAASATTAYSLNSLPTALCNNPFDSHTTTGASWFNYMVVCIDVGYFLEATRAMVRVTEIQTRNKNSDVEKAKTVDLGVLSRLVEAVVRTLGQNWKPKRSPK